MFFSLFSLRIDLGAKVSYLWGVRGHIGNRFATEWKSWGSAPGTCFISSRATMGCVKPTPYPACCHPLAEKSYCPVANPRQFRFYSGFRVSVCPSYRLRRVVWQLLSQKKVVWPPICLWPKQPNFRVAQNATHVACLARTMWPRRWVAAP